VRVADKADDGVSFFCAAFARMDGRVKGGVCEKGGVGFDGRNANEAGAAARVADAWGDKFIALLSKERPRGGNARDFRRGFVLPKNVGHFRMRF
jgi:hypothetical protein